MSVSELLITSDADSPSWSVCAWDPATGTQVAVFRGGRAAPGTLALLAGHTLAVAERQRPALLLWRLARRDAVHQRLTTGGAVSALAADPAAVWCVVAVAERLHVYQLSSGRQLTVLSRHYQTVTQLAFTDDGSHFVSAADDGLVAVWPLVACVDAEAECAAEPLHVWSDHSRPVTGLHVGGGGVRARVCTCSQDRTAKVYQLATGQLLLSVSFDVELSAVSMDPAETVIFVGSVGGDILAVSLTDPPRSLDQHVSSEAAPRLSGHTGRVCRLAVSSDGRTLASAGADSAVRLWHVPSRQCVRTLPHRGTVTNLSLVRWPTALRDGGSAPPPLQVAPLQRQSGSQAAPLELDVVIRDGADAAALERVEPDGEDDPAATDDDWDGRSAEQLRRKLDCAHQLNSSMYEFMVNKLLGELG